MRDPGQLRGEDGADGAGIDRTVGVAAGALVDRADVEACRAANAGQSLAADRVGEGGGAAVIEQDEVEFPRPVALVDAGPHGGIGVHSLPGRRARQQLQEDLEILEGRHELFDAHHRDQGLGQGQAHAAVALGLDHADGAGLGDREVRAGDGDLGAQELLAQVQARGVGQVGRVRRSGPRARDGRSRPSSGGRSARISARLRCTAGKRMCEGRSPASCTISSARSVS